MSSYCEELNEKLAAEGLEGLRHDEAAQQHLAECEQCFSVFEAIEHVDPLLEALPEHDAPDALVARTIQAVRQAEPAPAAQPQRGRRRQRLLQGLNICSAALRRLPGVLLSAAAGALRAIMRPRLRYIVPTVCVALIAIASSTMLSKLSSNSFRLIGSEMSAEPAAKSAPLQRRLRGENAGADIYSQMRDAKRPQAALEEVEEESFESKDEDYAKPQTAGRGDRAEAQYGESAAALQDSIAPAIPRAPQPKGSFEKEGLQIGGSLDSVDKLLPQEQEGAAFYRHSKNKAKLPAKSEAAAKMDKRLALADRIGRMNERRAQPERVLGKKRSSGLPRHELPVDAPEKNFAQSSAAAEFLAARSRVEGLTFKEAAGYWANTYVPGDPTVRRLNTILHRMPLKLFEQQLGRDLQLHQLAQQTSQPFDAPQNSSLAVYLHADRSGLTGQRRMLVQVGLQASSRRSGSRPAMNIGVVLDMRSTDNPLVLKQMKELVFALNEARDIGDRFILIPAGRAKEEIIPADDFRHGPLKVMMENAAKRSDGPVLSVKEAIETAIARVSDSDDPTAPLGSSAVLLVSGSSLAAKLRPLVTLAHQSSVAGIPVSTVAVGEHPPLSELEQIALAGQGSRRVLKLRESAEALVKKELSAVSEVVARAVRLRIRLAPGVKLIEVIGSHRLDERLSERVRQAEQSIDRRMSRNLGIAADRGEDEEGIQIVIPTFYAGTSHVVLLDVVASGPGPLADVTVRYKDLVHLRNGVARTNLSLDREIAAPGPLERNVIKNLLAFRTGEILQKAGDELAAGRRNDASRRLAAQLKLLESFRETVSGFERDPDIAADIQMLTEYLSAVGVQQSGADGAELLANSMAYAGRMKTLPPPEGDTN